MGASQSLGELSPGQSRRERASSPPAGTAAGFDPEMGRGAHGGARSTTSGGGGAGVASEWMRRSGSGAPSSSERDATPKDDAVKKTSFRASDAGPTSRNVRFVEPTIQDASTPAEVLRMLLDRPDILASPDDDSVELRLLVRSLGEMLHTREEDGLAPSVAYDEPRLIAKETQSSAQQAVKRMSYELHRLELHETAAQALKGISAAAAAIEDASRMAGHPGVGGERTVTPSPDHDDDPNSRKRLSSRRASLSRLLTSPESYVREVAAQVGAIPRREPSSSRRSSREVYESATSPASAMQACKLPPSVAAPASGDASSIAEASALSIATPGDALAASPAEGSVEDGSRGSRSSRRSRDSASSDSTPGSPKSPKSSPRSPKSPPSPLAALTRRFSGSRPSFKIDASSGASAHTSMLASLAECRARASAGSVQAQAVLPRVAKRRTRRAASEIRQQQMARLIQSHWRRQQGKRIITGKIGREASYKDFDVLLADLAHQSVPRATCATGMKLPNLATSPGGSLLNPLSPSTAASSAQGATDGRGYRLPTPVPLPAGGIFDEARGTFVGQRRPPSASPSAAAGSSTSCGKRPIHGGRPGSAPATPPPAGSCACAPGMTGGSSSGSGGLSHCGSSSDIEASPVPSTSPRLRGGLPNLADGPAPATPPPPRGIRNLSPKMRSPRDQTALTLASAPELNMPPPPSLDVAKGYAQSLMLRQPDTHEEAGGLFPLYTSLRNFDRLGTDISQYMHFMYWSARLFFALFMLNLSNLVINWEGEQLIRDQYNVQAGIPAALTWHSLGNSAVDGALRTGAHSYVVIEFFTTGILVCYLFYLRGRFDEIHTRIRNSDGGQLLTAADFTVMVSHVPESWGSQQLRDFFEKFGEVVHVGFSLNYGELIKRIRKAKTLREQHTNDLLALLVLMGKLATKDQITNARQRARNSLRRVEDNNRTIKQLMRERYTCTGYAFVTFNKYQVAQAVLAELPKRLQGHKMQTRVSYLFGGHMRVRRAPEPADIIWENLQCSWRQQFVRQVITTTISLFLVTVGTVAIFVANMYIAPGMKIPTDPMTDFMLFVGLYLGSLLVLVSGHLVVFIIVPLLVIHVERPHTNAAREMSLMIKLTAFMVLNTMINGLLFLFPPFYTLLNEHPNYHFSPGWYVTGGQVLLMSIIGDLLVVNLILELFRPGDLIRRFFARRAQTQQQMNELYACPGELILPYRICIMCKCMVCGTMFSFALPVLHLVIAAYMWMGHWVDRYTYLRRVTPPPPSHDLSQMNVILTYVFPSAILLHAFMAFKFLGDICHREIISGGEFLQWLLGDEAAPEGVTSAQEIGKYVVSNLIENNGTLGQCARVFSDTTQCITLPGHDNPDLGAQVASLASLIGVAQDLKAQVAAAAGGAVLSEELRVELTCFLRNESDAGAICVEASGSGGACAVHTESSIGYIFLIVNAVFWGLITIFFVVTNSSFFKKREMRRRLERLKILKTSAHLDLWRFLVQRDIRDPKIKPAPPNAQVRQSTRGAQSRPTMTSVSEDDPASRASTASSASGKRQRLSQKLTSLRKDKGGGEAGSPQSGPASPAGSGNNSESAQLSAHALMYLPPLTVHLLNSYYDNANTSNKLLASYLLHYVAKPVLHASATQEDLIPAGMRKSRTSMLTRDSSTEDRSSAWADPAALAARASGIAVESCGAVLSVGAAGAKAGAKAGATVMKGVTHGGQTMQSVLQAGVSAGYSGGAASAAALQDNVRKLKAQLNSLETQLTRVGSALPNPMGGRPRKSSLAPAAAEGMGEEAEGEAGAVMPSAVELEGLSPTNFSASPVSQDDSPRLSHEMIDYGVSPPPDDDELHAAAELEVQRQLRESRQAHEVPQPESSPSSGSEQQPSPVDGADRTRRWSNF